MGAVDNGGLYVKLGQGLACLNHILPREYTETLQVLQDKVAEKTPQGVFLCRGFKPILPSPTPQIVFVYKVL